LSLLKQAFDEIGIGAQIRQSDFREFRQILSKTTKDQIVVSAVAKAATSFGGHCGFRYELHGSRTICCVDSYTTLLVLRKIANNLRVLTPSDPSERSRIVKVLLLALKAEPSYRIYRFDIRRFFDSLDVPDVLSRIEGGSISQRTRELLSHVLSEYSAAGHQGIPTGLGISAVLSELAMKRFDEHVRSLGNVIYFARFVDDIIIVTSGKENPLDFEADIVRKLPKGAKFGVAKLNRVLIPKVDHGSADVLGRFEYLGYSFTVRDVIVDKNKSARAVEVELCNRSLNRVRTRIAKAFRQFKRDGQFDDLYMRILYLTSNYRLFDPLVNRKRLAGVHHNHPYLSFHRNNSLQRLDLALRAFIFSSPSIRGTSDITLTTQQKQELMKRSFVRGHKNKEYFSFSIKSLARIKRCWFNG